MSMVEQEMMVVNCSVLYQNVMNLMQLSIHYKQSSSRMN